MIRNDEFYMHRALEQARLALEAGEVPVGAVVVDVNGNCASATSTGGLTNKQYGRIGDSPIIGSGTYAANATCAISCTQRGWCGLYACISEFSLV